MQEPRSWGLTSFPGMASGPAQGIGSVSIPAPGGDKKLFLGLLTVHFLDIPGESGTVTLKIGGGVRWSAQVNGGLTVSLSRVFDIQPGQGVVVECSGAHIWLYGGTAIPHDT